MKNIFNYLEDSLKNFQKIDSVAFSNGRSQRDIDYDKRCIQLIKEEISYRKEIYSCENHQTYVQCRRCVHCSITPLPLQDSWKKSENLKSCYLHQIT